MSIYLWVLEAVLAVLWAYSLYAIINPKDTVNMTVDKFNRQLKFYAFNAVVKPTKRSVSVIKWGHMLILAILTVYMVMIYLYGNLFLAQFAM